MKKEGEQEKEEKYERMVIGDLRDDSIGKRKEEEDDVERKKGQKILVKRVNERCLETERE